MYIYIEHCVSWSIRKKELFLEFAYNYALAFWLHTVMLRCSGREVLFKQIVIFFIFVLFILAIFSASINHTGALWDVWLKALLPLTFYSFPWHNHFFHLCVCQSVSPPSCQINKAFRISRDPAPHSFTDCQPPTNHSIPVSTYNSSLTLCLLHLISHHYVSLHLTHLLLFASSLLLCALLFYFCRVTLHFPCSHFTCFFFNFCYSHFSSFSVSPLFMFSSCPHHLRPFPFSLSVHFFDFFPQFPTHIFHSQSIFYFHPPLPCLPSLMSRLSVSASLPPQYLQRRQQENAQRQSRGEPPLPEEDISKLFKPPQPPPRMDTLLIAGMHANTHSHILRV